MSDGRRAREPGQPLEPCSDRPNCACSDDLRPGWSIDPLELAAPAAQAWAAVRETIAAWPRTTVVEATDGRIRAECRSRVFRFVDDVELVLRADDGLIAMRSAARAGFSDFGVNRRRLEGLCADLRARGVVR